MSQLSSQALQLGQMLTTDEIENTVYHVRRLYVSQLKIICRSLLLSLKGKRQDLIDRLEQEIYRCKQSGETFTLLAVRTIVLKMITNDPVPEFHNLYEALRTGLIDRTLISNQLEHLLSLANLVRGKPRSSAVTPAGQVGGHGGHHSRQREIEPYSPNYEGPKLKFQNTIFYLIQMMLLRFPFIMPVSKGRNLCHIPVRLEAEELQLLHSNLHMKLYLFCGLPSSPTPKNAEILFPPIEIHVDGLNTKQYVKGLKGKPGTCRPADLTQYAYSERPFTINIVYSDASEMYLLYLYIVEARTPEEIVTHICQEREHILALSTKEEIIREYKQNEDDDIVMATSTLTLRCPLTYARMSTPVRSIECDHIQCFDGLSFLTMQERIPSWICPVCLNKINPYSLALSDYVKEILDATSDEVDSVKIGTDGSWEAVIEEANDQEAQSKNSLVSAEVPAPQQDASIEIISLDSDSEDEQPDVTMTSATGDKEATDTVADMAIDSENHEVPEAPAADSVDKLNEEPTNTEITNKMDASFMDIDTDSGKAAASSEEVPPPLWPADTEGNASNNEDVSSDDEPIQNFLRRSRAVHTGDDDNQDAQNNPDAADNQEAGNGQEATAKQNANDNQDANDIQNAVDNQDAVDKQKTADDQGSGAQETSVNLNASDNHGAKDDQEIVGNEAEGSSDKQNKVPGSTPNLAEEPVTKRPDDNVSGEAQAEAQASLQSPHDAQLEPSSTGLMTPSSVISNPQSASEVSKASSLGYPRQHTTPGSAAEADTNSSTDANETSTPAVQADTPGEEATTTERLNISPSVSSPNMERDTPAATRTDRDDRDEALDTPKAKRLRFPENEDYSLIDDICLNLMKSSDLNEQSPETAESSGANDAVLTNSKETAQSGSPNVTLPAIGTFENSNGSIRHSEGNSRHVLPQIQSSTIRPQDALLSPNGSANAFTSGNPAALVRTSDAPGSQLTNVSNNRPSDSSLFARIVGIPNNAQPPQAGPFAKLNVRDTNRTSAPSDRVPFRQLVLSSSSLIHSYKSLQQQQQEQRQQVQRHLHQQRELERLQREQHKQAQEQQQLQQSRNGLDQSQLGPGDLQWLSNATFPKVPGSAQANSPGGRPQFVGNQALPRPSDSRAMPSDINRRATTGNIGSTQATANRFSPSPFAMVKEYVVTPPVSLQRSEKVRGLLGIEVPSQLLSQGRNVTPARSMNSPHVSPIALAAPLPPREIASHTRAASETSISGLMRTSDMVVPSNESVIREAQRSQSSSPVPILPAPASGYTPQEQNPPRTWNKRLNKAKFDPSQMNQSNFIDLDEE